MAEKSPLTESEFMELAILEAEKAFETNEVPVGAVIVSKGKVISKSCNRMIGKNDPTAHAEIEVIREATVKLGSVRLVDCDLYVTLEPCPMCAQAISFARINALYYGAVDKKGGGVENGPKIFSSGSCNHKPNIYGGIYERECGRILKEFFRKKRP